MDPWDVVASRLEIDDPPWLRVRRDTVRRSNGDEHGYWVIEQGPWVQIAAITAGDEVVFVRQYRHAAGRVGLELPGGYADEEEPLVAAKRELLEETGYGGGEWRPLLRLAPNPALMNNELHVFLATGVEIVADPSPEEREELEVELHPRGSIGDLIESGAVFHALHVPALMKLASESLRAPS
jgi:8-oxo-dGTP pyrophosphatase MutT (NUDIX family)